MTPSIDDRLASVIRSLSDLILPSLPSSQALAIEQAHLCIGQLQIMRAQLDAAPAFEQEEADDARALATALLVGATGGPETVKAAEALRAELAATPAGEKVRETRIRLNGAIDVLIRKMAVDGAADYRAAASRTIISMEARRTYKDRLWFAPMGFDTDIAPIEV